MYKHRKMGVFEPANKLPLLVSYIISGFPREELYSLAA